MERIYKRSVPSLQSHLSRKKHLKCQRCDSENETLLTRQKRSFFGPKIDASSVNIKILPINLQQIFLLLFPPTKK